MATSSALRYGYQRKAHRLAELIDDEFIDEPATVADDGASSDDDANGRLFDQRSPTTARWQSMASHRDRQARLVA